MPSTTVHIPAQLLERLDAQARSLGLSRNRLILSALEQMLEREQGWGAQFLQELREPLDARDAQALDELVADVFRTRSSKRPPAL